MRSPRTTTESSPRSPQLEKARAQQRRPNAAKKKKLLEEYYSSNNRKISKCNRIDSSYAECKMHHSLHFYLKHSKFVGKEKYISDKKKSLIKLIFITVLPPPVRQHKQAVSVLSWAPRTPSPGFGPSCIGLRSYLFHLVKGLLQPDIANIPFIFCLLTW